MTRMTDKELNRIIEKYPDDAYCFSLATELLEARAKIRVAEEFINNLSPLWLPDRTSILRYRALSIPRGEGEGER